MALFRFSMPTSLAATVGVEDGLQNGQLLHLGGTRSCFLSRRRVSHSDLQGVLPWVP